MHRLVLNKHHFTLIGVTPHAATLQCFALAGLTLLDMSHLESAALTRLPVLDGDLALPVELALEGPIVLVLPVDGSPKKRLTGETAVSSVMHVPHRVITAHSTQNTPVRAERGVPLFQSMLHFT